MYPSDRSHLGRTIDDIDTPALLIDYPQLRANVARMAEYFEDRDADLRPHAKTHKCPQIAALQVAHGALGVTCAKLGEAEVMANAGIESILIANQLVGARLADRLARLIRHTGARVMPAVDAPERVAELARAGRDWDVVIPAVVEVDIGLRRGGVRTLEEAFELARTLEEDDYLSFDGVIAYEGHALREKDPQRRAEVVNRSLPRLIEAAEMLRDRGLDVPLVSAGSTGTYTVTGNYPGITEIEAGSYVFMDANYLATVEGFPPALHLLTTVTARHEEELVVADMGLKTVSVDQVPPLVVEPEGVEIIHLSEEHVQLGLHSEEARQLRPGDRLKVVVGHCCTNVNLHDRFYVCEGDTIIDVWPIAARGRSQ
ncbi:MAG: alanine racemase [Bacillota bacterium]